MDHHHTTRRAFLKGLPVAIAVAALPAAAMAVDAPVTPAQELQALTTRIATILKAEPAYGIDRVEVEKDHALLRLGHPETNRIERLIKAHDKAYLAFSDSVNVADELHEDYGGAPAERLWHRRERAEHRAFIRLLEAIPANAAESNRKGTYLLTTIHGRWEPDLETTSALIRSLLVWP